MNRKIILSFVVLGIIATPVASFSGAANVSPAPLAQERAGWLLRHASLTDQALVGFASDQVEIGDPGVGGMVGVQKQASGSKAGLHIISSLIMPGSGEAMLGYKRGYLMMAADIFSWTRFFKYKSDGDDIKLEFFAYADQHWSQGSLVEAYRANSEDENRNGLGAAYYPDVQVMTSVDDLGNLPLWVSEADDHWEYYENLGKWDQFVFGWDDFVNPNDAGATGGYVPTGTLADLQQPFTSVHRDIYREMRGRSDDAYTKRDNWLLVSIGLRVFSVLQTAYLDGVLGGGQSENLEVSGHSISFLAQPMGWDRGTMAAAVSF